MRRNNNLKKYIDYYFGGQAEDTDSESQFDLIEDMSGVEMHELVSGPAYILPVDDFSDFHYEIIETFN